MKTETITIRLEPELIQKVKNMAVAREKSTNAILQEIIKSGISLTEKLHNDRKTLSTRQQSSLQNFGAQCAYEMLIIMHECLLKNDIDKIKNFEQKRIEFIDKVIGLE